MKLDRDRREDEVVDQGEEERWGEWKVRKVKGERSRGVQEKRSRFVVGEEGCEELGQGGSADGTGSSVKDPPSAFTPLPAVNNLHQGHEVTFFSDRPRWAGRLERARRPSRLVDST